MKQFILIFMLGIFCLNTSYGNIWIPPDDGIKVRIILELGSGRDCDGWGICDSQFVIYSDGFRGGGALLGSVSVSPDNNYFELTFSRDDLVKYQPDKLGFLADKSVVTFDEQYVFPSEVREAAEAEKDLVIKPGTYPLSFVEGLFTIKIPY